MGAKRKLSRLNGDEQGVAAIEFALVMPFLMVMFMAIVSYGGYFWIAHAVQQLANDGARAAIAGLDDAERQILAKASLGQDVGGYAYLDSTSAQVSVSSQGQRLAVQVDYDASGSPFWAMDELVPMPSSTIHREAVVRLGGY